MFPSPLVPSQHGLIKLDPRVLTPKTHQPFRILQQRFALDDQRNLSSLFFPLRPDEIEQQPQFPIPRFFGVEIIESCLRTGVTEPFVRRNGFGWMTDEEGMVDRRVEEEFCGDERRVVVCPGAGGSERRD